MLVFCADFHWGEVEERATLSSLRGARAAGVWGRVRNDFPSLSGDARGCRGSGERQPYRRPVRRQGFWDQERALLHKLSEGRSSPYPRRI